MGSTFNSSSTTKQFSLLPSDKIKRSLNRATISLCASVRYLECTSYKSMRIYQYHDWMSSLSTYHSHGVQLLKRAHTLEKKNHHTTTFDCFNGTCQCVGGDGFKILQDTHAISVTKDLVCLLVVGVANISDRNEQLERILSVGLANTLLDLSLDLGFTLLAMAGGKQRRSISKWSVNIVAQPTS